MLAWLYIAGLFTISTGASWGLTRWLRRWGWLPFVLPALFFFGLMYGVMWLITTYTTCDRPDCGPSVAFGAAIVSGVAAMVGLLGAALGGWLGTRKRG